MASQGAPVQNGVRDARFFLPGAALVVHKRKYTVTFTHTDVHRVYFLSGVGVIRLFSLGDASLRYTLYDQQLHRSLRKNGDRALPAPSFGGFTGDFLLPLHNMCSVSSLRSTFECSSTVVSPTVPSVQQLR